jgi:CRISPR-associated protein Csd1
MIIPALVRLYDRMLAEGDEQLAPPGYSRQKIGFKVVLEKDGTLLDVQPVAVLAQAKPADKAKSKAAPTSRPPLLLVPGQGKPPGIGINPCFLWDNAAYMLGLAPEGREQDWATARFQSFRERHQALRDDIDDKGFDAVCEFLKSWTPSRAENHREVAAGFGVFQIRGEPRYVHEREKVGAWWRKTGTQSDTAGEGPSLLDGTRKQLARLHKPELKVAGAQTSGAKLVSFEPVAFRSYGKDQGANAPVGEDEAFKYCTALNRLTGDDSRRVRLGGDTIVFWSEGAPKAEAAFFDFFGSPVAGPDAANRAKQTYERAAQGKTDDDLAAESTPFYVLGLAPNAARVAVRLWLVSTVGDISQRLREHVADITLDPTPPDAPPMTIHRLVAELAPPKGKPGFPDTDRLTPGLAADVLRAILVGGPFPTALLSGVLARCRVEGLADPSIRKDWRDAQHRRCALIRACLLRAARSRGEPKEVPVSLNPENTSTAYQLGRLFAVLERAQENALGKAIGSTVKDRFFGAAMTTPSVVFPRLLRLSQHHLRGIDNPGQRTLREKELGEVMGRLTAYPRTLGLEDQGLFAIGYYHQRQGYFTPKTTDLDPASLTQTVAP